MNECRDAWILIGVCLVAYIVMIAYVIHGMKGNEKMKENNEKTKEKKIGSKTEFDSECARIRNEIEALARTVCNMPGSMRSWNRLCYASELMGNAAIESHRIEFTDKQ